MPWFPPHYVSSVANCHQKLNQCMQMVWMIIIMYTFIAYRYYRHSGLKQNSFSFRLRSIIGGALSSSGQWTITAASAAGTSWIRVLAWKWLIVGATDINWCRSQHVYMYLYAYVLCLVYWASCSYMYAAQYLHVFSLVPRHSDLEEGRGERLVHTVVRMRLISEKSRN